MGKTCAPHGLCLSLPPRSVAGEGEEGGSEARLCGRSLAANLATFALSAALAIIALACSRATAVGAGECGPFGDAPAALLGAVKPTCGEGQLLGPWPGADGSERYACLFAPASAGPKNRLPLLVYLHPSLFGPTTVSRTGLLELAATYPLGGNPKRPGFIVLAPQGRRTTHYYPFPDNRGTGWDNWYRQLNPAGDLKIGATVYRESVDAAAIDHFIMQVAASGTADTRRIYVTGWSNGAAMALLYALNRPNVAAVAVYSGPDPFGAFDDPCPQMPIAGAPTSDRQIQIFNPRVPVMHVRNSCDVAGICPNDERLAAKLRAAGVSLTDVILDGAGKQVEACWSWCGTNPDGDMSLLRNPIGWTVGLHRHNRWPSEWNPAMLDFLRRHPLQPSAVPF
jgi:poly(3-hydroxybutyrate) depolymerase